MNFVKETFDRVNSVRVDDPGKIEFSLYLVVVAFLMYLTNLGAITSAKNLVDGGYPAWAVMISSFSGLAYVLIFVVREMFRNRITVESLSSITTQDLIDYFEEVYTPMHKEKVKHLESLSESSSSETLKEAHYTRLLSEALKERTMVETFLKDLLERVDVKGEIKISGIRIRKHSRDFFDSLVVQEDREKLKSTKNITI